SALSAGTHLSNNRKGSSPAHCLVRAAGATALLRGAGRGPTPRPMRSPSACYGYVSAPWVNLDLPTATINDYYPPRVRDTLLALAARPMPNVVKSHHPADLFATELPRLTERYDQAEGGRQGVEAAVAAAGVGDGGEDVANGQRTPDGPPGRGN